MDELTKTNGFRFSRKRFTVIICSIMVSIVAIVLGGFLIHFIITRRIYFIFILGFLLLCLVIIVLYIFQVFKSLKLMKTGLKQLKKIEKVSLSFSLVFLFILPTGGITLFFYSNGVDITETYYWNDGPWITFGDDPKTEISITWLTKFASKTIIEFGTQPNNLEVLKSSTSKSHLHTIKLEGLQPNTIYYYSIGVATSVYAKDQIFAFKTAPQTNESFKVIIVGDMQPGPGSMLKAGDLIAKGIVAESPNFVIQLGDLASNGGIPISWHYTAQNFPQYAATIPFQIAIGNHDYSGNGATNFRNMFPYSFASETGLYYSIDYASAHFIFIDNFDAGNAVLSDNQKLWVEQDITAAKSRGQKWIFINFHNTLFTTGTSSQNFLTQTWLVPLANKYNIDGIFFGHDHHYEHWNYTYGNLGLRYDQFDTPSGNSTHFWCTGGGGADLEVDYGVLNHDVWIDTRRFFNSTAGTYQDIAFYRSSWNASRVVDSPEHQIYAASQNDGLYYQVPSIESYSTDNEFLGYMYGEQTRHYMMIEINAAGTICTISAHYPNSDLLLGPNDLYPQTWTFSK
ncbi:MAG: metallophosphoesterase family protein [Asgard group archaeon]|nr:metallophosphoesterase family protein [Asgard group archaeon]